MLYQLSYVGHVSVLRPGFPVGRQPRSSSFVNRSHLKRAILLGLSNAVCASQLPDSSLSLLIRISVLHLERAVGVEPTTASLEGWDSTAELRPP